MVEQGDNYLDSPVHAMAEFFEIRIENLEKLIPPSVPSRNNKKSKKGSEKRKAMTLGDSEDEDSDQGHTGKKFRQHHGTYGHTTDQCTTLKELVKQANQKKSKCFGKKKRFTKHDVNVMVQKEDMKALKQKRRKPIEEIRAFERIGVSDSDKESIKSSSSEEGEV